MARAPRTLSTWSCRRFLEWASRSGRHVLAWIRSTQARRRHTRFRRAAAFRRCRRTGAERCGARFRRDGGALGGTRGRLRPRAAYQAPDACLRLDRFARGPGGVDRREAPELERLRGGAVAPP